jgi:hypothetical protein
VLVFRDIQDVKLEVYICQGHECKVMNANAAKQTSNQRQIQADQSNKKEDLYTR